MFALIGNGMLLARSATGYLRSRVKSELGQDLIEYAMLGGLIAAGVAVLAAILVGTTGTNAFTTMGNAIAECINFDSTCP